jgi:hypothetical protein
MKQFATDVVSLDPLINFPTPQFYFYITHFRNILINIGLKMAYFEFI